MNINDLAPFGYTPSELKDMSSAQIQAILLKELNKIAVREEIQTFEIRRLDLRHEQFKQILTSAALACVANINAKK